MKLPKELQEDLINSLREVDPEEVIVFASYPYGEPGINSDIDLYVVTKDKFFAEQLEGEWAGISKSG